MGGKLKTIKRLRKVFLLYDYEKEEQFLSKMHAQGWRFVDTNGYKYTFEQCEPEKVVYRIDFSGVQSDSRDEYYALFKDYGWEYLQDINNFSYFRKSAEGVSDEDLEIFSDGQSRIDMAKRILRLKLLPLMMLVLLLVIPQLPRLIREVFGSGAKPDVWDYSILGAYVLLFALYLYIAVRCLYGYLSLKKKYQGKR